MSFNTKTNLRYPPLGRRQRLGFVGGGRGGLVGDWHYNGARLSNHWDVVAGALSSRPDNAHASARDWFIDPARSYTDFRVMAEQEAGREDGIEAVSIVTPNWTHAEMAIAFMQAGIDVILDKPMTTTVDDARKVLAVTQETARVLVMTYPYTHHAMVRQAQTMISNGAIGAVRQVHVEYLQEWNTAPQEMTEAPWRQIPEKVGRSSIIGDIGTHAYHLLHVVTGLDVAELRADMHICGGDKALPDTAFVNLRLSNDAPGLMHVSQAAPGQYCGLRLRVWGDKGAIEWDQEKPEYLKYVPLDQQEQVFVRSYGNGILPEAARLVHLPHGHGEALTVAWSNLYAEAAIAIAARRSGELATEGLFQLSGAEDGLRGMLFTEACADSHEAGGVWTKMQAIS